MYNNNEEENVLPEAGPFISALRNSGYSNVAAIEDLIDNSIDAKAGTIMVDIADDLKQIFISDNGCGMSPEELRQAIKLGGKKIHSNTKDLGKYGLGLITASISISPRLRVVTKKNGVISVAIFDCNEVIASNKFKADFREATEAEILSFNYRTNESKSGTVLSLENCDKIQYPSLKDFTDELSEMAQSAYWSYINEGKDIMVNGKSLEGKDPLWQFDPRTRKKLDKTISIPLDNGKTEKMEILAVEIPDLGIAMNKKVGNNTKNQGFYIQRNNREIASAYEIREVFKKHNDFNLLRIKLNFGPGLDEEMGVNYTKHNISPNKKIIALLNKELEETIGEVRDAAKERQKKNREKRQKALLNNPFTNNPSEVTPNPIKFDNVNVEVAFKKEKDSLFNIKFENDSATVLYNGKNRFYKEKIAENEGVGLELKRNIDLVLKALLKSSAENAVPTEVIEKIGNEIASALEESVS